MLVWLWGADSAGFIADTSAGGRGAETIGVGVVTAVAVGLTTLVGFSGLIGETGELMFVGLVTLLTQVFVVAVHGPIMAGAYGFGHDDVCICVMLPVYPVGH